MGYLYGRFKKPLGGFSADFRRPKFTRKVSAASELTKQEPAKPAK
jgi:hypothetical protein